MRNRTTESHQRDLFIAGIYASFHAGPLPDIWAFIDRENKTSAAWLYKNDLGDYYAQFNYRVSVEKFHEIPLHAEFFAKPKIGQYLNLVRLSPSQIVSLENALIAMGYARVGCFSKDASM